MRLQYNTLGLSNEVYTFVQTQGAQKLPAVKYKNALKMSDLCTKTEMLKLLRLETFEPLKVEQSYIPLLKALMYGISASGAQGRDST